MPGFVLARACAEAFPAQRHDGTVGMVLLNHGLFTFADDARTAYENHLALVDRALARLEAAERGDTTPGPAGTRRPTTTPLDIGAFGAGDASAFGSGSGAASSGPSEPTGGAGDDPGPLGAIAGLRRDVSRVAGAPMVLRTVAGRRRPAPRAASRPRHRDPGRVRPRPTTCCGPSACRSSGATSPATPVTTRPTSRATGAGSATGPSCPSTPRPGSCSTPSSARSPPAAGWPTPWPRPRSSTTPPGSSSGPRPLGGYVTPSEADIFDVEYWELEQAKLARQPAPVRPLGPGGAGDGGRLRHRPGHAPRRC